MVITADFCKKEIENLQRQKSQFLSLASQASGAIQAFEAIVERLEETEDEVSS